MTMSPKVESYELYVLRDRRWELHSRFDSDKRRESIKTAKRVATQPDVDGVKVVKDDLDPETGKSREQTIFKLYRLERGNATPGVGEGAAKDSASPSADDIAARLASLRQALQVNAIAHPDAFDRKFLGALAVAAMGGVIAAATLFLVPALADAVASRLGGLSRPTAAGVGFGFGFLVVFGASALVSAAGRRRRTRAKPPMPPERLEGDALPEPPPILRKSAAPPAHSQDLIPLPEPASTGGDRPPPPPRPQPRPSGRKDVDRRPSGYLEKQVVVATRFVARLLRDVDPERDRGDPEAALGIDLFMAGAISGLAKARSLPVDDERRILREALQLLGRRPRQADGFIESLEAELARRSQAVALMVAGRDAMDAFLAGETALLPHLDKALGPWHQSAATKPDHPAAFLSVDTAPFADPAQMRDEVLARNAEQVRDRLFRTALKTFGGTEIRQELRGLVAAFPSVDLALDAAIHIQREAATHNQANPGMPVHVQIGLDSGNVEATSGTPAASAAETAAWACRKAQRDQILVSDEVRKQANGRRVTFREAGTLARENLYDSVPLFEVGWVDPAADAVPPV